ncbi:MAG: 50S ribosomal protein L10 [Chloroflexota bacterium]
MLKEKKAQIVEELGRDVAGSSIGILTDFRGLSAADMVALRRKLRPQGLEFRVVKNTLARLALENAGRGNVASLFQGQIAVAFGHGEPTEAAKAISEYLASTKISLTIKGAFLGDRALTPAEVTTLARLPSRQVLLAQVIGGMQAPVVRLVNALASPLRGMLGVLQARIRQLESSQPAGQSPPSEAGSLLK